MSSSGDVEDLELLPLESAELRTPPLTPEQQGMEPAATAPPEEGESILGTVRLRDDDEYDDEEQRQREAEEARYARGPPVPERTAVRVLDAPPASASLADSTRDGPSPTYDKLQAFAFAPGEDDDEVALVEQHEADRDLDVARNRRRSTFRRVPSTAGNSAAVSARSSMRGGSSSDDDGDSGDAEAYAEYVESSPQHAGRRDSDKIVFDVDDTALSRALLDVRLRKRGASWAAVWRHAIVRVKLGERARGVVAYIRWVGRKRAQRGGVELAEKLARQALEDRMDAELLHLFSYFDGPRFREAFEHGLIIDRFRREMPLIGGHEAGVMAIDVSCRRALRDERRAELIEGGAYCKVRRGEYVQRAGRESVEMFAFDVNVDDSAEPFTVEVWAADPRGVDTIVGAFQLQPAGMPRAGRGDVTLTLRWNWDPTVQPGRRMTEKDKARYAASAQHQRQAFMSDYRRGSSRIIDQERWAWRGILDAFALEERLLSVHDRRQKTRDAEALLREEEAARVAVVREFRRDRLQLEEELYRWLLEGVEAWARSAEMDALVRRVERKEGRWEREFRRRHGIARHPAVTLHDGDEFNLTAGSIGSGVSSPLGSGSLNGQPGPGGGSGESRSSTRQSFASPWASDLGSSPQPRAPLEPPRALQPTRSPRVTTFVPETSPPASSEFPAISVRSSQRSGAAPSASLGGSVVQRALTESRLLVAAVQDGSPTAGSPTAARRASPLDGAGSPRSYGRTSGRLAPVDPTAAGSPMPPGSVGRLRARSYGPRERPAPEHALTSQQQAARTPRPFERRRISRVEMASSSGSDEDTHSDNDESVFSNTARSTGSLPPVQRPVLERTTSGVRLVRSRSPSATREAYASPDAQPEGGGATPPLDTLLSGMGSPQPPRTSASLGRRRAPSLSPDTGALEPHPPLAATVGAGSRQRSPLPPKDRVAELMAGAATARPSRSRRDAQ